MLPDTLEIVDTVASSLIFDPVLTARDRAVLFAVSWCAGRHPNEEGIVLVPDLPLRRALGDMRRPDAVKEGARYARLEHARMRTDATIPDLDGDGVLVPTVEAALRRRTLSGARQWLVEPAIVRSFKPYPGDVMVGVPLPILARARSRYTLQIALRVLAWGNGYHLSRWLRRTGEGHRVLRIPTSELITDLGLQPQRPADILRHDIMPAIDEIRQLTDFAVDIEPWHAPSIRKPRGRVMGFDILIGDVATTVVPEPERPAAENVPYGAGPTPGSDNEDEDIAF